MKRFISFLFIISFTIPCLAQAKSKKPKEFIDSLFPSSKLVFLIPEKTKGQLISIEFENPSCKTLKWKDGVLKCKIPKHGNLCISNRLSIGSPDEEFYIVGANGKRKIAKVQEQIFNSEIKLMNRNDREVIVFRFFYGTKELARKLDIL